MAFLLLVSGWMVIWAAGAAITAALLAGRALAPGRIALVAGIGWFVGAWLLTLWMRALSAVHVPFGIAAISAPFIVITLGLGWRALNGSRQGRMQRAAQRVPRLPRWQRLVAAMLAIWLAMRFAMMLVDVLLRPLYPWDAWTQWSTKARVWFELHTMAPFVTASEWLQAPAANVYFDAAPHYPGTVPLWQVWSATLIGRWDDSLVNLPWWLTAVAFALSVYGLLAQERFSVLMALVGTWLVLSLPILDVHVALAGYAGLPMATYLTVAAVFAVRGARDRDWRQGALALILIAACTLIKNPGKLWVLVLVPGLVAAWMPRAAARVAVASIAGAIAVMAVLAQTEPVILGYRLHLDFDMPWNALSDAYFEFGNWHLLWYGCIAIAVLAWRQLLVPAVAPYTLFVAVGVLFLMFGFGFTNARAWVEDQSTVNRATLHLAPLAIVWMLMAFRAWSEASAGPLKEPLEPAQSTA